MNRQKLVVEVRPAAGCLIQPAVSRSNEPALRFDSTSGSLKPRKMSVVEVGTDEICPKIWAYEVLPVLADIFAGHSITEDS